MKDSNSDLFDPVMVMESEWSRGGDAASEADFGFAFNDSNFSDRILRIEIMDDPVDARTDSDACATIADWARHRKRRREDIKKENAVDLALLPEEQVLNGNQPDMDDFAAFNAVYEKYFTSKPARSCVAVKTLPKNVLCEVEAIAVK